MIGILLLSHGKMSEGVLDSCQLFFGDDIPQIKALCLAPQDMINDFDDRIVEAIKELDDGKGVIAVCDLFGGTPANRCIQIMQHNDRFRVITGMNLGLVIELLGVRQCGIDHRQLDLNDLIESARGSIVDLETCIVDTNDDSEEGFF